MKFDYYIYSPNHSGKAKYKKNRITPHHTAGKLTAKEIGNIFKKKSRNASCNIGIGNDGKRVLVVKLANRSWCSSSADNDNRAYTIEVSNSKLYGDWPVSEAAYESLLNTCYELCKKDGFKKLIWINSKVKALAYKPKDDEMILTVHKWFSNTTCCGPYLYKKMPDIAAEVTRRLNPSNKKFDESKKCNFKVKANKLNLHKKANKNSEVIKALLKGEVVTGTGYYYPHYTQVTFNGKTGWLATKYIEKTTKKYSKSKMITYQVTTNKLNLRKGAGTKYAIIKALKKGDKVTGTGYYYPNHTQVTVNGKTGWVATKYIKKV